MGERVLLRSQAERAHVPTLSLLVAGCGAHCLATLDLSVPTRKLGLDNPPRRTVGGAGWGADVDGGLHGADLRFDPSPLFLPGDAPQGTGFPSSAQPPALPSKPMEEDPENPQEHRRADGKGLETWPSAAPHLTVDWYTRSSLLR